MTVASAESASGGGQKDVSITARLPSRCHGERRASPCAALTTTSSCSPPKGSSYVAPPRTPPTRALSPRQARWLHLRPPPDSETDKHAYPEQLLRTDPDIRQAYALTVEFEELVRGRERDRLATWLDQASGSRIPEIVEFAHGLQRDRAAAEAALTHEWSSGHHQAQASQARIIRASELWAAEAAGTPRSGLTAVTENAQEPAPS